ncbi:MAG: hypothetical protein JNL40_17220 [Cyclobacteriaceae bacterium]|nr:hypothetical protein [Cyclobacteriaceae bacterium]
MKTRRWLISLLLVIGCNLPPDLPRDYFYGEDTTVCVAARPLTLTTDLTFEVDVMQLTGFSKDYTLEYLDSASISFTGTGQYVVESITEITMPLRPAGPVAVLLDQSGTYANVDSSNFRSKQLNQFIHELPAPGQFILGGFAQDGLLADSPVEFGTPSFTTDGDGIMPFLFGLSKRTGGKSVVYDAVASTVNLFSAGSNRSLLLLAHDGDSVSTGTITTAVNAALAQSVRVDVIFMGDRSEAQTLTPLSQATGGVFVTCTSDLNMVTAFNHLNNINSGKPYLFRVKVRFTPPSPLMSGQDTFHEMVIHDSISDTDYNPVSIYIRTP